MQDIQKYAKHSSFYWFFEVRSVCLSTIVSLNTLQNQCKMWGEKRLKMEWFLKRNFAWFFIDFGAILVCFGWQFSMKLAKTPLDAPKTPPGALQDAPRPLQDRPGAARKRPGAPKGGPRGPQEGFGSRPRGSKNGEKSGSKRDPVLDPSWTLKKSVLGHGSIFGPQSGRFLDFKLDGCRALTWLIFPLCLREWHICDLCSLPAKLDCLLCVRWFRMRTA